MPRIKKRGLDYFPIDIDFMHSRQVRRIMKAEGDAAIAILIQVYCSIYADQGYYVKADDLFFEDQADNLHDKTTDDVRHVVNHALELGLFNEDLYREHGILTSADIQRQFLFATKRRSTSLIDPRYCLISSDEPDPSRCSGKEKSSATEAISHTAPAENSAVEGGLPIEGNAVIIHKMGTFASENSDFMYLGTHSIAQNSIAQQRITNSLLNSSPGRETIEKGGAEGGKKEIIANKGAKDIPVRTAANNAPAKASYQDKIAALEVPQDGLKRNYEGLLYNMSFFHIPPDEQYAIIMKSNFGVIGHPVWTGFYDLRGSHGKIRLPGRYLLSLCR